MNREEIILEYSKLNGAAQVWSSWRWKMMNQGREVNDKFHTWPIPERDIELDAHIAFDVVDDFLIWAKAHHKELLLEILND